MLDRFGDWDVISRKTNKPVTHMIWITLSHLISLLLHLPGDVGSVPSTATWTLRNRLTGEMRSITADCESLAAECVAKGIFDHSPRWKSGWTVPLVSSSEGR